MEKRSHLSSTNVLNTGTVSVRVTYGTGHRGQQKKSRKRVSVLIKLIGRRIYCGDYHQFPRGLLLGKKKEEEEGKYYNRDNLAVQR